MNEKQLALALFAIRELQGNIKMNENIYPRLLKDFYGCAIANDEQLFDELEELAQSLNCGGSENV